MKTRNLRPSRKPAIPVFFFCETGNFRHFSRKAAIRAFFTKNKSIFLRYLIRSCAGKLRIGVSEQTVLAAIARAVHYHELTSSEKFNKDKMAKIEGKIKEAFSELPNYKILMEALLEHGSKDLEKHVQLQPGVPLKVSRNLD